MNRKLRAAMEALARSTGGGVKTYRFEAAVDEEINAALAALAESLGGEGSKRSEAGRVLMRLGAKAYLAE